MEHILLLIYIVSLCLASMTIFKTVQFNNISPNSLTKKIIMFLILFAVGALLRLILKYQGIIFSHDNTLEDIKTWSYYFERAFSISSSVFFFYYLNIIFTISYGVFFKRLQIIFIALLTLFVIIDVSFNDRLFHLTGISSMGNQISRLMIYCTLGFTLLRALRSKSEFKPAMLKFALLYFSMETVSLLVNDILKLWQYYDSVEYLINNLVPFLFAVPFMQSLFPKPDTDFDKMKAVFQPYGFNERELSIIKLICDGKLNKEIASELGIAENTVKFYIYNIYKKINVKNRVELVKHITAYPPNKKPSLPR